MFTKELSYKKILLLFISTMLLGFLFLTLLPSLEIQIFGHKCNQIANSFDKSMCVEGRMFVDFFRILFFLSFGLISFIVLMAGYLLERKLRSQPTNIQHQDTAKRNMLSFCVIFFPLTVFVFIFIPGTWYYFGYLFILFFIFLFFKYLKFLNGNIWPIKSMLLWLLMAILITWLMWIVQLDFLGIADGIFDFWMII